ncbi:MAG: hypothetical protein OQK04_11760 [Kangiellaceae bacterium]|nr:hypothetical protein [Kangiellaceae bacterium]MCW8999376.1 hypothetical protein [Kangiellaceae bacterium]
MTNDLTQRELFHFALYASKNQRTDDSIKYLKAFLKNEPNNAEALFLLGSEYAEISMVDEAKEELSKALEIAPQADLVRFQLAMLHFSTNDIEHTQSILEPLATASTDNPYQNLATGVFSLIENNPDQAIENFELALTKELNNPALVANIESFIKNIKSRNQQDSAGEETAGDAEKQAGEMFLSVYKN